MSAFTLIAYDGSGSTGGHGRYHDLTQEIVARHPDAAILYWDSTSRLIGREALAAINHARRGGGGTETTAIAQHLRQVGFHGHLVIISDGQVSAVSIDRCGDLLGPDWKFASVTAHLIDTGGPVNMSVTCPFTRVSAHEVFCYRDADNYERMRMAAVSEEDLAAIEEIDTIATVADYEARAELLERLVVARTMGTTGDPRLRDRLLAMKKRITAAEATARGGSDAVRTLVAALEGGGGAGPAAVAAARAIHDEYYGEEHGWSARISRLVSLCEGALRGVFDLSGVGAAVRGDRVRRADAVATVAVPVGTEGEEGGAGGGFVCPITFDATRDVMLLVIAGEPVLGGGLDASVVNDILDCPLNLLRYPAVVDALVARLDHPVSLAAWLAATAAAEGTPMTHSPMTRRELLAGGGGICIGNTEAHCRATAWTLAQLTTGGKLVGNADLWMGTLWLLIRREPRLAWLRGVEGFMETLTEHCRWRLREHTSFIGLTGAPEFPITRVPVGVAIWYVFASALFTGSEPRRELIRSHMAHLDELAELLLELTGFVLPAGIAEHTLRVRVLLSMLGAVKRDRWRLPELLRGLVQASLVGPRPESVGAAVRGREHLPALIPLDGPPTAAGCAAVLAALPAFYAGLSDLELVALGALVGPDKAAGDIPLPVGWRPGAVIGGCGAVGWGYGLGPLPKKLVRICPATCRPYYTLEDGRVWSAAAESVYGIPVGAMMSLDKKFGDFVCRYGAYPTREELLVFIYNRYVVCGRRRTLPAALEQLVSETMEEFAEIMRDVPVAEFVARFTESCPIERRRAMEAGAV